jgi:hypothetical protein
MGAKQDHTYMYIINHMHFYVYQLGQLQSIHIGLPVSSQAQPSSGYIYIHVG